MDNTVHWATQYIGRPWETFPHPPHSFHCWALVQWIQEQHFDRLCPLYDVLNPLDKGMVSQAVKHAKESLKWRKLTEPEDGCVVAMSDGAGVHHVGVYLKNAGDLVIHCGHKIGVVAHHIRFVRRVNPVVEFYKHITWP